jgi:hypothetical protein
VVSDLRTCVVSFERNEKRTTQAHKPPPQTIFDLCQQQKNEKENEDICEINLNI